MQQLCVNLVGSALHEQQLLHRLSLLQACRTFMEPADKDRCSYMEQADKDRRGYVDAQVLPCVPNPC